MEAEVEAETAPYHINRMKRLWAADRDESYPYERGGRQIGRVVIAGPLAGFYPNGSARVIHDAEARRREKEQNRRLGK